MKKARFSIAVFTLACLIIASTSTIAQDKNILIWSDKKLTWDDYQGRADENESNSILSYMDFTFNAKMQGNGKVLDVEVNTIFDKVGSLVGDQIKTDDLLQRQQMNFDITEKYARLYRKELQGQKWESKSFQKEFLRIHKTFSNENKMEQKNCERETKKGKDSDKVSEWQNKIAKELKQLDKYSAAGFIVKLKN